MSLTWACARQDLEAVKAVLSDPAVVKDGERESCLIYSAALGNSNVVELLLDCTPNPNIVDKRGWTPLLWALVLAHGETALKLFERGARLCGERDLDEHYRQVLQRNATDRLWMLATTNPRFAKMIDALRLVRQHGDPFCSRNLQHTLATSSTRMPGWPAIFDAWMAQLDNQAIATTRPTLGDSNIASSWASMLVYDFQATCAYMDTIMDRYLLPWGQLPFFRGQSQTFPTYWHPNLPACALFGMLTYAARMLPPHHCQDLGDQITFSFLKHSASESTLPTQIMHGYSCLARLELYIEKNTNVQSKFAALQVNLAEIRDSILRFQLFKAHILALGPLLNDALLQCLVRADHAGTNHKPAVARPLASSLAIAVKGHVMSLVKPAETPCEMSPPLTSTLKLVGEPSSGTVTDLYNFLNAWLASTLYAALPGSTIELLWERLFMWLGRNLVSRILFGADLKARNSHELNLQTALHIRLQLVRMDEWIRERSPLIAYSINGGTLIDNGQIRTRFLCAFEPAKALCTLMQALPSCSSLPEVIELLERVSPGVTKAISAPKSRLVLSVAHIQRLLQIFDWGGSYAGTVSPQELVQYMDMLAQSSESNPDESRQLLADGSFESVWDTTAISLPSASQTEAACKAACHRWVVLGNCGLQQNRMSSDCEDVDLLELARDLEKTWASNRNAVGYMA